MQVTYIVLSFLRTSHFNVISSSVNVDETHYNLNFVAEESLARRDDILEIKTLNGANTLTVLPGRLDRTCRKVWT